MDRRRFVKIAAAGLTGGVAGCMNSMGPSPRTPTGTPEPSQRSGDPERGLPFTDRFDTVIDVQSEGADENNSLFPIVEDHFTDDTLFYLPPGRYLLDETILQREFENVGFVGRDAVVAPGEGFNDYFFDLGRPGEATDLLFQGITFDFRGQGAGSRPLSALVDDGLIVRDISVFGRHSGDGGGLRIDVTDDDGVGIVERALLPDGAAYESEANGCLVGEGHEGEVRFINCHLEGFPDNGLYADPENGTVKVFGGYYANCEVSCIRVGNDSLVQGAHVRCDSTPDEFGNMRGIRLTSADGAVVEHCVVEMIEVPGSDGGITFGKALASATVRNTEITVDANDINAIQLKHAEDAPADEPILIQNVSITGSAANRAAVEVHERENCTFDGVTIEQSGPDRDGLVLYDESVAAVRNCRIDVTGRPIAALGDSSVRVTNTFPAELNTVGTRQIN